MKTTIFFLFIAIFCVSETNIRAESPTLTQESSLREQRWPEQKSSQKPINLKFASIELTIPKDFIRGIEIFNSDSASISIHFGKNGDKNIFFIAQTEDRVIGKLHENLDTKTSKEFFEKIGQIDTTNEFLKKAREVFGLTKAKSYINANCEKISSFYIESKDKNNSHLYLLIDGDNTIYQISGYIDNLIYTELLSWINCDSDSH